MCHVYSISDAWCRLNVLRAIISETSNASKTSSPIKTNMQVLSLLRKKAAASKTASQEFAEAKRDDLKQKQDAEIAVLDEYAGQVETMPEDDISQAVEAAVKSIESSGAKMNAGMVLKELFKRGGRLEDKAVEKAQVAAIVKHRLSKYLVPQGITHRDLHAFVAARRGNSQRPAELCNFLTGQTT